MAWPLTAGLLRLPVAVGGGWLLADGFGIGPAGLFAMVGIGLLVFGGVIATAIARGAWRPIRS
jgi:hypothetical protein